jgi:hypothetical protein
MEDEAIRQVMRMKPGEITIFCSRCRLCAKQTVVGSMHEIVQRSLSQNAECWPCGSHQHWIDRSAESELRQFSLNPSLRRSTLREFTLYENTTKAKARRSVIPDGNP